MSPTSFLTSTDVADLTAVNLDGFETLATVYPDRTVNLVFARWVNGVETTTAPQRVLVEWETGARSRQSESALVTVVDGWLTALAPFNVEVDDLFSLGSAGDEQRGRVTLVLPAALGTQRAGFVIDVQER